jgi:hypothetical protein
MKPLTARALAVPHRSPDEDARSMRPATIGKKKSLVALAAPAAIGVQNRGSCGQMRREKRYLLGFQRSSTDFWPSDVLRLRGAPIFDDGPRFCVSRDRYQRGHGDFGK